MAHNKLYRNFIILQEDERGYSRANDKALSGYAKIEAKGDKCKVSFYAQNLRQEDNYSMVLICCKRDLKQLINLGPLVINGVGKGDASKEYYVNNIAGLGISYEKISGAAICKTKDNENEFIMHGFMNGEDSTDNWKKYKTVKVDSKKYINKLDEEPKKKDSLSSSITDKTIVSQPNIAEIKTTEASKLGNKPVSGLGERKNDESKLQFKENLEVEAIKQDNSKEEVKEQIRVSENHKNIIETIKDLDEDRNKCKELKKCEHVGETKKCCKDEMNESVEETINKLAKKLDNYDGVIDLRINNLHDDVIIYGFIRDKKNCEYKWKRFKLEKKCRDESIIQSSSRRIEENFKLDNLDQSYRIDRLDIADFDKYESSIMKSNLENMNQKAPVEETNVQKEMPSEQVNFQKETPTEETNVEKMTPIQEVNVEQKAPVQGFEMKGEISIYFENLAQDFESYQGNLADINYCKLYKVDVNSIEDLCDESNYNKYTLAYYPMLNYYPYISKVGYFLLGYKCNKDGEMQYIVYGIPGSKEKSDQPYGGRTGFVTWTSDDENDAGYWLMFYDFKNSSIVIPTK